MQLKKIIISAIASALAAMSLTVIAAGALNDNTGDGRTGSAIRMGMSGTYAQCVIPENMQEAVQVKAILVTYSHTGAQLTIRPEDELPEGTYFFCAQRVADAVTEQHFDEAFSYPERDIYEFSLLNSNGTLAQLERLELTVSDFKCYDAAFLVTDSGFELLPANINLYHISMKVKNGARLVLASSTRYYPEPIAIDNPIEIDPGTGPRPKPVPSPVPTPTSSTVEPSETPVDLPDGETSENEPSEQSETPTEPSENESSERSETPTEPSENEPSQRSETPTEPSENEPSERSETPTEPSENEPSERSETSTEPSGNEPSGQSINSVTSGDTSAAAPQNSKTPASPEKPGHAAATGDSSSAAAVAVMGLAAIGAAFAAGIKRKKEQ